MDNAIYAALNRQSGLMAEMQVVANNIANLSTSGFRREGVIFAEHVADLGDRSESLSMADAAARRLDTAQGPLTRTGGTYDFAIEGDGFFLIETPQGQALTRAGSFGPSPEGELVTADGYRLLDAGGTAIAVPADAQHVRLASDGTLSADGVPLAQLGLYLPATPSDLRHDGGARFTAEGGLVPAPAEGASLLQGFIEGSNVNPVTEIARMIEVQRSYELGQTFLDREDNRIRSTVETLAR